MAAKVQRLRLRLFIEGVEIPVISAQVQVAPNSPMVASIQIPPLAEATRFLPRSLIHLYFLDFYEEENPNIRKTGASVVKPPGPSVHEAEKTGGTDGGALDLDLVNQLTDNLSGRYKLLFLGDLMGFQWTKSPTNRSVVLQCSDPSNYWDYAFQYNNTDLFGPGIKAMFSGSSTNLFTDMLSTPGEAVMRIIQTPSVRYPKLKGLLGGVVHLLEAMGGSYYYDKKFAGQNIFFSIAELRLHITQMITAYAEDDTTRKLLGGSNDALFGRSIGNLGEQASFRKVINMLASVIFHETYGQPCPLYIPGSAGTISGFKRQKIQNMPIFGPLATDADQMIETLTTVRDDIATFEGLPKESDQKSRTASSRSATRDVLTRLATVQSTCNNDAGKALREVPAALKADVPQVGRLGQQVSTSFKTSATLLGRAVSQLKAKVNGGGGNTFSAAKDFVSKAQAELKKISSLEANITPPKQAIPARLNQQIFRPDVWFSAPPRCNVIFPDQYSQLTYSRQFMQEPTRLLLKTSDTFFGEDELFDHFYFAPKAITLKQEANTLQAMLKGDILDHELFSGILPVFEKMGEFNIFAARSGMVDNKTPKVGLAQRSTNFLYFKYRFAARQLQITGKFNPYIACGFPGLIIDKYVDLDTLRLHQQLLKSLPNPNGLPPPELLNLLGTHFLGNFTEVSHQVSQTEGTTSINCSYARQPEETVEFLGNVQQDVEVMKKQPGKSATVKTTVASIFAPRINSQGPNFGRITEVQDVTDRYRSNDFYSAKKLPVFGGNRDAKTKQITTTVPVGFQSFANLYGKEVVALVGDPNLFVTFRAYDVTEEKAREKKETVTLAPEEYIRPGWYGDCWHPSQISKVYYDFFNTGAITEPQQIQNVSADGSKGSFSSDDADTALADAANSNDPTSFARDQLLVLSLEANSSIAQAVSYLVLTYTIIRQAGFDTEQFLRSYTWRPIASMLDMFGSSDLQLDAAGKEVVSGIEGFHSRAFGSYSDLFGLVTPDMESIVGIQRGSIQAQKADTRGRKRVPVLNYIAQLRLSKAILG